MIANYIHLLIITIIGFYFFIEVEVFYVCIQYGTMVKDNMVFLPMCAMVFLTRDWVLSDSVVHNKL